MKKLLTYLFCMIALTAGCCINLSAQEAATIIRGKVVDKKDKSPIVHVSVAETDKDGRTVRGTTTDIDGNYALKISNPKNKITFSYIGYKTLDEEIKGRTTVNVSLEQGSGSMDEVIVVSAKKTDNGNLSVLDKNLTIASSKIAAKDLEEMASSSIDQALQGRMSGVDITASSGDPGAGMSIRIRGTSSINAATNPLIVVDGVPYETAIPSDFNFGTADDQGYAQLLNIAPSDIKEIVVLKDAAATAMWGSRAASGVLLITTKRGSVGKPILTYTFKGTVSKQPQAIPLLNGDQYSSLIPEEYMNGRNGTPLNTLTVKEFAYDKNDPYYYYNYGQNTDWLGAITQLGFQQDHNMSLTGGGEKARYFTSLGYFYNSGTTIGTSLKRINARINLDYVVSQKIKFATDIAYTYTDNPKSYYPGNAAQEIRNVALNKMPNMSIYEYNEQGVQTPNYFSPASNIQGQYPSTYNPVAMANEAKNRVITNRVTPHFNLQYQILPGVLTARADIQFDISSTKSTSFLPQVATGRPVTETSVNRAYAGDVDVFNVFTKTNLIYTPHLPEGHDLQVLASLQTSDVKTVSNQALTSNTASSLLQDPSSASRTQNQDLNVGAGYAQTRTVGLLINPVYSFNDKYFLNVGVRGDGSSRFGPSHRYGLFPSVSSRWRMSSEGFMKNFKFINDLSFRLSWGQSGNAPKYDYSFYNNYGNYGWSYQGVSGVYPSSIELSNLRWEVINGTNFGLNFIAFQNKINIDFNVYRNRTNNLLFYGLQIPSYTGYSSVDMNIGKMDNQGWELNVLTTPLKTKNWVVDFNFNISQNQNIIREISPFYPQQNVTALTQNGVYQAFLQINNPFGSIYGYRYQGVYKDKDETIARDAGGKPIVGPNGQGVYMRFNYPTTDYLFQPGDAKYEDINHDGNIDYKDVVYLGNSNPKFVGGFGPTVTYKKNLKISAFFNFRYGGEIVNGTQMTTTNMYGFNNQSTAVLRRWRKPGDETDMPRALYNTGYNWLGSDRYVQNNSFLRFRTITVRYTFNTTKGWVRDWKLKGLSAYATAENLVTFTKYTGQDPEVAPRGITGPFTIVTDNSTTPPVYMYTLGISVSF